MCLERWHECAGTQTHTHTHRHRKLSVSLNVFGLEDPTVCVTLYIYSVRLCRWDCVLPVGVVQLHCSETHTTDQTRWKNEETSPSFNLHYTVHSIRSALWGGHPQRTQLKCACMCERAWECAFNQKLFPPFFALVAPLLPWLWFLGLDRAASASASFTVLFVSDNVAVLKDQPSPFSCYSSCSRHLSLCIIQGLFQRMHFFTTNKENPKTIKTANEMLSGKQN